MKYISGTFYGLFILLLLAVAGLFLASLLPIPGNVQIKIVKSGSMEPSILTGSVVLVKPSASYAVGDVITFGADSGKQIPTTHRIVSVTGDFKNISYETKGDANEEADEQTVAGTDVIGKVLFTVPYAGFVLDFARQPIGFTLMIGIPAAVIIFDELIRIFREVKRMRSPHGALARRREEDEERDASRDDVVRRLALPSLPSLPHFDSSMRFRSMDGIRPRNMNAYE